MGEPPSDQPGGQRRIPAVHQVLAVYRAAGGTFSDAFAVPLIRSALEPYRQSAEFHLSSSEIAQHAVAQLLRMERPKLRPALNGTGVILHTNLGRAPVSKATAAAMADAASSTVPLELDAQSGQRGKRMEEIVFLLRGLTGAESALVVNNNAAAVLLVLSALAAGREVLVSRGEAVEIGGGVRIPDVLAQSGARMVEVGTTNRTYATDYAHVIGPLTAALLKVHPSNFKMSGFVRHASLAEVAPVARGESIPLIEDQGSGLLIDPVPYGLTGDRPVAESLKAGADIVTMSGDKLIGGPQAGIILGRADLVERCMRHPLARAMRADKVTLAGVAETLRHYARGEAEREIPIWTMIATPRDALQARGETILRALRSVDTRWCLITSTSTIGGGSLPGATLPSLAIARSSDSGAELESLARDLRTGDPAVYGRIENGRFLVDLRTIPGESDALLTERLSHL
jgi:L-seryl-tRNA(Ser) seleniumtransferase